MSGIVDLRHELESRAEALAALASQAASESMRAEYLKMAEMYRRLAAAERDLATQRSMASVLKRSE